MNKIEQEFINKGAAARSTDTGWFVMSRLNAIDFVEACEKEEIEILGIDSFYLHENGGIEPSMEHSIDFTSPSTYRGDSHRRSKEFLKNQTDDLFFEIVCSSTNKNETNKIFDKIKKFTVEQSGVEEIEVTEDAALENDLGIYGDDAMEYLVAFGKKFNVDVSRFITADYFSGEGDEILPAIIRMFTGKKKRKLKELTIRHLLKAVVSGRLDEEVINSATNA